MSIILSIPDSISVVSSVDGVADATSSSACKLSTLVGIQVGKVDLSSSQLGPCVQRCDDLSWLVDNPLVRRLAGLSDDGVNDQVALGKVV